MSKKSNLAYVGIGAGIVIVAFFAFALYLIIDDYDDPYLLVKTNGMNPTISKGEVIEYDRNYSFDLVMEEDIIVFFSDEYSTAIIQRVTEIVQEDPRQVKTKGDSLHEGILLNTPVIEEQFMGKVLRVYPNFEATETKEDVRNPYVLDFD